MKNQEFDFYDDNNHVEENEKYYKLGIYDGNIKAQQNSYDDGFRQGTEVK